MCSDSANPCLLLEWIWETREPEDEAALLERELSQVVALQDLLIRRAAAELARRGPHQSPGIHRLARPRCGVWFAPHSKRLDGGEPSKNKKAYQDAKPNPPLSCQSQGEAGRAPDQENGGTTERQGNPREIAL